MEYGILRVNKIKLNGISKAFQQHHQREASFYKSNPDIDISKIGEDVSLIHSNNFKKDIQMQLALYHITKTPRKDAIGLIDGVITASPKFFEGKSKQAIIGFFKRAIPLIKNEFGPIISMPKNWGEVQRFSSYVVEKNRAQNEAHCTADIPHFFTIATEFGPVSQNFFDPATP